MAWSLILHGGAKDIPPAKAGRNRDGCARALNAGTQVLREGGSALDAVEATVRSLEDDPIFNAGFGSVLNSDGQVQMDAAIMEGDNLQVGAVGALVGVRHPVSVARRLLRERTILLVGDGAARFAREHDMELCEPEDLIAPERRAEVCASGLDTVGCVARDHSGLIVSATSTGGLPGKLPGRVGDSPLVGCGFYADNAVGGTSFSGDGENIARTMLASRVMHELRHCSAQAAADHAIHALLRVGGEAGSIVMDRHGGMAWAHNSRHFAVAYASSESDRMHAYLSKAEERERQ